MAAEDDGGTDVLRPKTIKKICLILISFIPAVALLSVTNVVVAHVFVVKAVLFPPKTNAPPRTTPPKKKKKKVVTKVETKTVHVPPTQEDLDRIAKELETSDPLPPLTSNDNDNHRSAARIQSGITSMESLLKQREGGMKTETASKDIDELPEAYQAFVERLEQETSRGLAATFDEETAKPLEDHMTSLKAFLDRTSFTDLDRQALVQVFMMAMEDLRWLLSADLPSADDPLRTALFRNVNNTLLAKLVSETQSEGQGASSERNHMKSIWQNCQSTYLALDKGEPAAEFIPPKKPVRRSPKKEKITAAATATTPPQITEETARESDLYELVESIKQILTRRDLASAKVDQNGDFLESPISDEGVEDIRSKISPMVQTIENKWRTVISQEAQMREYWVGRAESMKAGALPSSDSILCASPDLVEGMMNAGFEAMRQKGGIKETLGGTVMAYMDGDERSGMIQAEMETMNLPAIDYSGNGPRTPPPSGTSSWKLGKQSVSYVVDGPLLHRGVKGWIDNFVDYISGYNDWVDAALDYIVGDDAGSSVGTSTADTISRLARKVHIPEEYVERMKKSGILSGRTRGILEE